ncbi:MAG: hypothetical protein GY859_13935 [Desulfobacterales bacterium]|nr:hypothetical protein [Desulfobacterales bacterium]
MTDLTPIELEDGAMIYIESTERVNAPDMGKRGGGAEEPLVAKGGGMKSMVRKFESIEGTIRAYTTHALKAFKNNAVDNVEKVTLEFGVKVGGEAGIPYVTKGSAESHMKITVHCAFPKPGE